MSKHTISHADQILAGEGVAFNAQDQTHGMGGEDISGTVRGIRIAALVAETLQGGSTETDAFALAQTPAAGTADQDLTLNGGEVVDGVGDMRVCSVVSITSSGADAGRTFTVLGKDANGRPQAEEITGPATTTVFGVKTFTKIDRVIVDADTAGAIQVGQDENQKRGLKRRMLSWDVDYTTLSNAHIPFDSGGNIETAGSFGSGSLATQTATNVDPRATYTPVDLTGDLEVIYLADLTKDGMGENYTDSRQNVPSAI